MCPLFPTVRAVPGSARLCLLAALVASAALPAAQTADKAAPKNPSLEKALESNAPKIVDSLRSIKHPGKSLHVGVLRFRVQVGETPASDNAGPLNLLMASRLEAALILALNDTGADKIRILHNPSAVVWANGNTRANPDTPEGRKAFFTGYKYPPAWKEAEDTKNTIPAHAFLTGLVKINDEAKTANVRVCVFDGSGESPKPVCTFEAIADPRLLTEAGVSFALPRGGNLKDIENLKVAWENQDATWQTKAKSVSTAVAGGFKPVPTTEETKKTSDPQTSQVAIGVSSKTKKAALVRKLLQEAPIQFEIFYDGKPVEVREDGSVPEPPTGAKVKFRLKHKNQDDSNYGIVLKINGQNTIFPEEREIDDFAYQKWVLAPDDDFEIRAFHMNDNKAREFEVSSPSESRRAEAAYGQHAGMFAVVVFQERRDGKETRLVRLMNGNDVPSISRGVPSGPAEERNHSLKAVKKQLNSAGKEATDPSRGSRGLVAPGKKTKQEVQKVAFKGYPIPVSVIQIRYYKPQSQEE